MTRFAMGFILLAACFPEPRDPYAGQTTAGGYQWTNDQTWAACQQQANEQLAVCNSITQAGQQSGHSTNSAWELRASYDRIAQTCPAHAHDGLLGQYEQCVVQLEASDLKADPAAPARRESAKPRVAVTKQDPTFQQLVNQWAEALDGKNIACRDKQLSDSHARACERGHAQMGKVEDRLEEFLIAKGYDKRDFRVLGLWPMDRDWRRSPN
jgi:hypothetical protein